jgi:manganese transport protein
MYKKILVAVDNSPADENLLAHAAEFAPLFHSEILLLHVADGWAARRFEQLKLAESEEMKGDQAYLEMISTRVRRDGTSVAI